MDENTTNLGYLINTLKHNNINNDGLGIIFHRAKDILDILELGTKTNELLIYSEKELYALVKDN